jgi:hypothetical protein
VRNYREEGIVFGRQDSIRVPILSSTTPYTMDASTDYINNNSKGFYEVFKENFIKYSKNPRNFDNDIILR